MLQICVRCKFTLDELPDIHVALPIYRLKMSRETNLVFAEDSLAEELRAQSCLGVFDPSNEFDFHICESTQAWILRRPRSRYLFMLIPRCNSQNVLSSRIKYGRNSTIRAMQKGFGLNGT